MNIVIHWVIAILIIALLAQGIYMTRMALSPWQLTLFRWHKEIGMLVLMLAIFRLIWRFTNKAPSLQALPFYEQLAARGVHWIFYFFMLLLPVSGWLLSSAAGIPVSFFGAFLFPDFLAPNEGNRLILTSLHEWLAYILIAVLCLHVAASLKHHFVNKDDILRRMLP